MTTGFGVTPSSSSSPMSGRKLGMPVSGSYCSGMVASCMVPGHTLTFPQLTHGAPCSVGSLCVVLAAQGDPDKIVPDVDIAAHHRVGIAVIEGHIIARNRRIVHQ